MKKLSLILFFLISTKILYSQQLSTVNGRVIDASTGQPIFGVTVIVREANAFAQTDFDGKYTLQLPPGTHTILFQMIGYDTKSRQITVEAGQTISINMIMGVQILAKVVVEERALNDTEASLLALQKKSPTISDGISQEAIKKSPDSSASDVVKRITGISIIGGKYVFVRGLGERYSSTMLNGSILPSPEPDKRVVPLDLFPASLIKNIRIIKTFIPEDPGEFSGGIVKIETVEYPDQFLFSIGAGIERNTNTTGNEFKKLRAEGGNDYLGLPTNSITGLGSKRWDLPEPVKSLPDVATFQNFEGLANITSLALDNYWTPKRIKAPYNHRLEISVGDTIQLFGKKFGYFLGTTYKKEYEKYNQLEFRWNTQNVFSATPLGWYPNGFYITDYIQARNANYYKENVLWGNNINLALKLDDKNQIYIKAFHSTNSDKVFRDEFAQLYDPYPYNIITETSYFLGREIFSFTIGGDHGLQYTADMKPHILKWFYNESRAIRDEPDRKNRVWGEYIGIGATGFSTLEGDGQRFFGFTEDKINNFHIDYELPYSQWEGLEAKLKFGVETTVRDKSFKSKTYRYKSNDTQLIQYPVPGEIIFNPLNVLSKITNFEQASTGQIDSYDSKQNIDSLFVQTDIPTAPRLRFIGGIRQESSSQKAVTKISTLLIPDNFLEIDCAPDNNVELAPYLSQQGLCNENVGKFKKTDILPSINLVYEYDEKQNYRFSYYETITRPDLRELSEFTFIPYFAGEVYQGNNQLVNTNIKNYDFRWEWYITALDYAGVAYFIKYFENPIEYVGKPSSGSGNRIYTLINSPKAFLRGIELDFRKDFLDYLRFEINFYSIKSEVIVMDELTRFLISEKVFPITDKRVSLSPTNLKRPLQGQSDNVYNLKFLVFFDKDKKTGYVGFYYNYFSDRILFPGTAGDSDIYEEGKGFWDFVASYSPLENLSIKGTIKNLFNTSFETYQKSNLGGFKVPYEVYKRGIDYSLSASYKF